MSQSISASLTAAPTANDNAQNILAMMAALSGVATDYNVGSQLRTSTESLGAVVEAQAIANQQQAYQGLTYGSISAFNIQPLPAGAAQGVMVFATTTATPATQNITIPQGTLVQTNGGVQFYTLTAASINVGSTSTTVSSAAVVGGTSGNVAANTITTLVNGLGYPVSVNNPSSFTGGSAAEQPSGTLARFAAAQGALDRCSPFAVANAAIGVSNGNEIVQDSSVYEPWADPTSGITTAGFTLYIDNGTGGASAQLIANVDAKISGNQTQGNPGNRPAGMPYSVQAVSPIYATVAITGVVSPYIQSASVQSNISNAVSAYFSAQGIKVPVQADVLTPTIFNAAEGYFLSLNVVLSISGGAQNVKEITPAFNQRVILLSLSQTITQATIQ